MLVVRCFPHPHSCYYYFSTQHKRFLISNHRRWAEYGLSASIMGGSSKQLEPYTLHTLDSRRRKRADLEVVTFIPICHLCCAVAMAITLGIREQNTLAAIFMRLWCCMAFGFLAVYALLHCIRPLVPITALACLRIQTSFLQVHQHSKVARRHCQPQVPRRALPTE